MPRWELIDLVLALLHSVAGSRHCHHGRCGGRRHRHPISASAPPPPQPSGTPHPRTLERPPSPSPNRPTYRPLEPSNPDTSPWGRRIRPCAVHGWGPCPNRVAPMHGPSSSSHQGEKKKKKKKKTLSATSRLSLTPLERRWYAGQRRSPLVHGADPKDRWCHGPPPQRQPRWHPPVLHLRRRHFLQVKQALRTPVCRRI
jgi:hypothetical protein